MISLLNDLKTSYGVNIRCICLDNAGENKAFDLLYKEEGMGVKFEHTAFGTLQQLGEMERKFATLFD